MIFRKGELYWYNTKFSRHFFIPGENLSEFHYSCIGLTRKGIIILSFTMCLILTQAVHPEEISKFYPRIELRRLRDAIQKDEFKTVEDRIFRFRDNPKEFKQAVDYCRQHLTTREFEIQERWRSIQIGKKKGE